MAKYSTPCLIALSVAGACVAEENCTEGYGTYSVRYFEQSGTCGDLPDQSISFEGSPERAPPPCQGRIEYSRDSCETLLIEYECPEQHIGDRVLSTMEGTIHWGADGSQGEATVKYVVRNALGHVLCWSVYEAELDRI